MKTFNIKNFKSVKPIEGFNIFESAILRENGFESQEDIQTNFYDYFQNQPNPLVKEFLFNNLTILKNSQEFTDLVQQFKNEKICILGDYDCDGIMGTSIIRLVLESIGYETFHIIPDRLIDGFAVKKQHIDQAIKGGAKLLITVDNGTSASEAIKYAKEKGLTVIITDHHLPDTEIPPADLIVNPHINDDSFEDICGAVVMMKLMTYFLKNTQPKVNFYLLETILCMGAIATIADMMPLIKENRAIVKVGLERINYIKDKGIYNVIGKLLAGMTDVNYMSFYSFDKNITEEALAYYMCPVINATGRVDGDVNHIVDDILKCQEDNFYLRGYREKNKERKFKTRELSAAHKATDDLVDITFINEAEFDYPVNGLIGLLANKISTSEDKPCFVCFVPGSDPICKLSGRSVNNYSIHDAFQRIKDAHPELEIEGGGHDEAVGIEMPILSVGKFKTLINEDYKLHNNDGFIGSSVYLADPKEIEEIEAAHFRMAPFGIGFEKLKLCMAGKIETKQEAVNMVVINGLEFKAYTKLENLPPVGANVFVTFSISFGNKQFSEFKIEEIQEAGC